ncbi:MAG: sugar ABC transporter permease [Bdellovibrionales bacterium]
MKALRTYTMVAAIILIGVVFNYATDGAFLQARNLSNLLRQMAVTGILAGGMVLIIVSSQIDLSIGSTAAFLGGVLAVISAQYDPTTAFIVTLMVGGIIGLGQGYLVAYRFVPSFIVTLGGMMAFRGGAMWITGNSTIPINESWVQDLGTKYLQASTGWAVAILGLTMMLVFSFLAWKRQARVSAEAYPLRNWILNSLTVVALTVGAMLIFQSHDGVPYPVLLMMALILFIHFLSLRTVWGRHIYAIGGNREAALLSGVPVKMRTLSVFGLMGLISAIGGAVMTARVGSASPDAGQLLELDAIAACVIGGTSLIGGKGSVFGAILGALLIESLNNGMSLANMEPYWQFINKGLVLVVAVWVDIASRES